MRRFPMILAVSLAAGGLVAAVGHAGQPGPEDLRAKARNLQQEADRLLREADAMAQRGGPHDVPPMEEMHRHLGNLKQKIKDLLHAGRPEEAEQVEREAQAIREQIERVERERPPQPPHPGPPPIEEMHRHLGNLKQQIKDLLHAGRPEEAEQVEREAQAIREQIEHVERERPPQPPHAGPPPAPEDRARLLSEAAEHMHQAAGRLHAVEAHELAEHLDREAGRIEQEVRSQMHPKELEHMLGKLHDEVNRLRRDMDEMRDRLEELRQRHD